MSARAIAVAALVATIASPVRALAQTAAAPTPEAVPRAPAITAGAEGDAPAAERLTFDAAVARALARNPTALEADAEIRRYRALMEEVRASSLPTLDATGAYTRLDGNRVSQGVVVVPRSAVSAAVTLSVPLVSPRNWALWSQAGDRVDVARLDAAAVRRTVAVATARAYLEVIAQKRLLETAVTARDNARAHYDFTRAQRVGGVGNRLDEARAAQELTTDEVGLQNEAVALFRAREALGVLVAGDGAIDATEETFGQMPTLNDALDESARLRADVRARQGAAAAADRRVDQAYTDYLPYLNLVAYPFYQNPPIIPTTPQTGWEAQLVLTLPIYDGGLRYGQERERKALADEARLDVEGTLRQAKSEVRAAFEEIQRADAALDQGQQSAAFARQALALANQAYRAGATTNLEVIDAERQSRDADTLAAVAADAARQARLDMLAASGRFPSR